MIREILIPPDPLHCYSNLRSPGGNADSETKAGAEHQLSPADEGIRDTSGPTTDPPTPVKLKIAALIMVYQLAVVQAQQVENVCLEVVDVDGLVDGVKADLVGRADGLAGPDAVSGHPDW